MKYRTVSLFAGCLLLFSGCKNHPQPDPASADSTKIDSAARARFFPITDFLQSEIQYIDSTPLAIRKVEILHNKADSVFLTSLQFHNLATAFLMPELAPDYLEKNYTESSFSDKTTGYLTFTYTPRNREQPLHRIDVLVGKGPSGADRVKSIYMEKASQSADTTIIKKMYWKTGHSFLVITSQQPKGKAAEIRQLNVVWNEEEGE